MQCACAILSFVACTAVQNFSTLSHKRHEFRKKLLNIKCVSKLSETFLSLRRIERDIAHLWQQCHNSKFVIFHEKVLKVLKCYNFLWVQRRHNYPPAATFVNCIMTLYLLKLHVQTFLSILINKEYQILNCDTLVANQRYDQKCILVFIWSTLYSCQVLMKLEIFYKFSKNTQSQI